MTPHAHNRIHRRGQRGAALIIVISILAILATIAVVFYLTTRREFVGSSNVQNETRAELLAQGATSVAMGILQQDKLQHPDVTSTDHQWTTYFNGAWLAGKQWAFPGQTPWWYDNDADASTADAPSVPYIRYEDLLNASGNFLYDKSALYVPRYQGNTNILTDPMDFTQSFVIDPVAQLPAQTVDRWVNYDAFGNVTASGGWADVDNDGDGLDDSMWLPMAADRASYLGRLFAADGINTPDYIDNDLDGYLDAGVWKNIDEADTPEIAAFAYIDEGDTVRLTIPLPGATVPVDLSSLGVDYTGTITLDNTINVAELQSDGTVNYHTLDANGTDQIDNDFSLIVNDFDIIAYPWHAVNDPNWSPPKKYHRLADYCFPDMFVYNVTMPDGTVQDIKLEVRCSGEVMSEVVGRAAVQIVDAASKVNLNAAGGHSLEPVAASAPGAAGSDYENLQDFSYPSVGAGVTTAEYCTRVLPRVDDAISKEYWQMLMGAPDGALPDTTLNEVRPYVPDLLLPGYGLLDDNGNALSLSMNGLDDDGDGLVDEGVNPGTGLSNWADYQACLWTHFEGVDEPGEYQLSRPLRNTLAENDSFADPDNDKNGAANEVGEFGDRVLRTLQETKRVVSTDLFFNRIDDFITLHSADRNTRFNQVADDGSMLLTSQKTEQGLKLDLNIASPEDIAKALHDDWGMRSRTELYGGSAEENFALGLQLEGVTYEHIAGAFSPAFSLPETPFISDPQLRALQLACNIHDFGDTDLVEMDGSTIPNLARTEASMEVHDDWWESVSGGTENRYIKYTTAGFEGIRITEMMVRPVRRIEAEMDAGGPNQFNPNLFSFGGGSVADFRVSQETMENYLGVNGLIINVPPAPDSLPYIKTVGGVIGENSVLSTYQRSVSAIDPAPPAPFLPNLPVAWPNIVEFSFLPSPGLPPGRYYLTINATDENGQPTISQPTQALFALKYVDEATGVSIMDDVATYCLANYSDSDPSEPAQSFFVPAVYGSLGFEPVTIFGHENMDDAASPLSGWSFLGSPVGSLDPDGNTQSFTVTIPDYLPAGSQVSLNVAVCKLDPDSSIKLSVNFFDFSQEPDHEWIEIENAGGQIADISDWQLVIGGVDRNGNVINHTSKNVLRVSSGANSPQARRIEPGGRRILAIDRDDALVNGISLLNGTIPPIPMTDPTTGSPIGPCVFATPDNRIIQLDVDALDFSNVAVVSNLVLGGGFFPNYPEHDGIDNDGDNQALLADGVDNDGDGFVDDAGELDLSHDGKDNDVPPDGLIDEPDENYASDGIDNDGDGLIDGDDTKDEGVDEGQYFGAPGSFSQNQVGYTSSYFVNFAAGYTGTSADPPEWKEFVERRFFPGDNVVITLFQGSDSYKRVADRVTYTERDVVNRSIDDVASTVAAGRTNLFGDNVRYLGFWPDNTMGIDFYRTLERKYHALYNGDRFGTSNRWEATDGNYDDWAHDPISVGDVRWNGTPLEPNEAYVVLDNTYYATAGQNDKAADLAREIAVASSLVDNGAGYAVGATAIRCDGFNPLPLPGDTCKFDGDPTRYTVISYDPAPANRLLTIDAPGLINPLSDDTMVTIYRRVTAVKNSPLTSVGDLTNLPYFSIRKSFFNVANDEYRYTAISGLPDERLAQTQGLSAWRRLYDSNLTEDYTFDLIDNDGDGTIDEADEDYRGDALDKNLNRVVDEPFDEYNLFYYMKALMAIGTVGQTTLTAGQADFYPLFRNMPQPTAAELSAMLAWPPSAWRPLFLHRTALNDVNDPYQYPYANAPLLTSGHFLFNPPPLPDSSEDELLGLFNRSAIERRAVVYVAQNSADLPSTHSGLQVAAEAMFAWTADDGITNGEYDLYIDVGASLGRLAQAPDLVGLGAKACTNSPTEMAMDIEAFSDRNNDGVCWSGDVPTFGSFTTNESFGYREGLTPDANGYVHYGMVRIENRFLALFLRNWSPKNVLNRFVSVILTPRAQTPGRFNVNTVATRRYDDYTAGGDIWRELNVLMGIPGLLLDPGNLTLLPTTVTTPPDVGPRLNAPNEVAPVPALPLPGDLTTSFDRARLIETKRPEYPDGRYYRLLADVTGYWKPTGPEFPLSNPNPPYNYSEMQDLLDESAWRMSRMANLVTTRSDVFEIVVTAQAGYLANDSFYDDLGNPQTPNWRSDNFMVQAETKTRTVYER